MKFLIENGILLGVRQAQGQVVIPEGVCSIADGAFRGESSIAEVLLPESLAVIGADAFADCSGLRKLRIGASVTRIGDGAFCRCEKLHLRVDEANTHYEMAGKCLVEKQTRKVIALLFGNEPVIPKGIRSLGRGLLCNGRMLKGVWLPESLEAIDAEPFADYRHIKLWVCEGSFAMEYAKAHGLTYHPYTPK